MKFRTRDAMKIYFYVLIADGKVSQFDMDKFEAIGKDMDTKFPEYKNKIINECKEQTAKTGKTIKYYSTIKYGIIKILNNEENYGMSDSFEKIGITLFLWDLLDIALCSHNCSENKTNLVKYITDRLDIDETILFIMSNSIKAIQDIDREIAWLKTVNKPYQTGDILKELEQRQEIIYNSIRELMAENAKNLMTK